MPTLRGYVREASNMPMLRDYESLWTQSLCSFKICAQQSCGWVRYLSMVTYQGDGGLNQRKMGDHKRIGVDG